MTERSITVRLRANVTDFKRELSQGEQSLDALAKKAGNTAGVSQTAMGKMVQSAQLQREAWTTLGTTATVVGGSIVAALAGATSAAISWESAWTGVTKTVDGTDEQMASLEADLRELATTLPATHSEIAAVAEAAGQLGIAREDVAAFTETMINLSETTNLTADEAATSIAQMMNIMQTAPEDVDNLGSALVALGNDGASTERDIIQMSQRIASSGKIIGLTEGEVMGLANALASTGIEVEAGGSAMSNILIDIATAVSENSAELETWAGVAGMTAQEFAAAWKEDPASAVADMIEGLGAMNAAGGDVFATLSDLGQTDIRVTRALLSMANSGDLLRESLELGNAAWEENTALIEEANKRYETAEAKIQVAKNTIYDAGITIGGTFMPAVAGAAEGVAGLASWFAGLPEPLQTTLTGLTGIAGAATLVAGGFALTVPRAIETYTAMRDLADTFPVASARLGKLTTVASRAATTLGVLAVSSLAINEAVASWEDHYWTGTEALQGFAGEAAQGAISIDTLNASFSDLVYATDDVGEFGAAVRLALNPDFAGKFDQAIVGVTKVLTLGMVDMTSSVEETQDRFEEMGRTLAALSTEDASTAFRQMAEATDGSEESLDNLLDLMPDYKTALIGVATENEWATDNATLLKIALGDLVPVTEEAADVTSDLEEETEDATTATEDYTAALYGQYDAQREVAGLALSLAEATLREKDATISAKDAIDSYNELVASGTASERELESARNDMEGALLDLVTAQQDSIDAMREEGASHIAVRDKIAQQRAEFIAVATQMGYTAAEAEALADKYGLIPTAITTTIQVNTSAASDAIQRFINTQNGRTIYLNVSTSGATVEGWTGSGQRFQADGGVMEFHARGGVSESHVAQIAPASTIRVWAEPETGGEAYIPLAPSKRARSTDILANVASRFGYQLSRFADGGFSRPMAQPPASSAVSQVVQVPVPTQVTVVDADGRLIGTMRTVATETASEWVGA